MYSQAMSLTPPGSLYYKEETVGYGFFKKMGMNWVSLHSNCPHPKTERKSSKLQDKKSSPAPHLMSAAACPFLRWNSAALAGRANQRRSRRE